jgi:hypothetical protein
MRSINILKWVGVALIILVSIVSLTSCTDAQKAKIGGLGDEFKIELVNCDGTITHTWTSTGKVMSEDKSDGYFFKDNNTGLLVEVTGTLIITRINK